MPPLALTLCAHAFATSPVPPIWLACGPVQSQIRPILIGAPVGAAAVVLLDDVDVLAAVVVLAGVVVLELAVVAAGAEVVPPLELLLELLPHAATASPRTTTATSARTGLALHLSLISLSYIGAGSP